MKELKKQLTTRHLLVILITSFFITSCNSDTEDFLEDSSNLTNDLATINVQKDLSTFNFENFVLQNNSFRLQINDTLSLDFEDVERPTVYDPEEDIVYTTKDEKGNITFDLEGNLYFVYNSDKGIFYGGLHNKKSEASFYTKEITKQEFARNYNRSINDKKLLETKGKHNVIEFEPYMNLQELSEEERLRLNQASNDYVDTIEIPSINKEESNKVLTKRASNKRIKIYVYTYKRKYSTRSINFAKIHTRNSLRHAYENNTEFYNKISTYFNASYNGNRVVNFPKASTPYELLLDWREYTQQNFGASNANYGKKYLLLTDFSFAANTGYAFLNSNYAWAHVNKRSHTAAAHEVGHMFNADHTGVMYQSGWWRVDVMNGGGEIHISTTHYDQHRSKVNRQRIKTHINDNTN